MYMYAGFLDPAKARFKTSKLKGIQDSNLYMWRILRNFAIVIDY